VLRNARIGWHDALPNLIGLPNADALRRTFQSVQKWFDFPIVGLQGSVAAFAAGNANVAWATEVYDDYSLHDAASATIRVPQQAQQYFVVGAATGTFTGAGAGRRVLAWHKNGVTTRWRDFNDTATSNNYVTSPFMGIVSRSDTLAINVSHNVAANLSVDEMELWLLFLPMGG